MLTRGVLSLAVLTMMTAVAAAGETRRPLLVTVDDLPIAAGRLHSEASAREAITRDLLATLAEHEIRAVGFVTWNNVRSPADRKLLEMWLDAGHELGNHGRGHLDYRQTPSADYIADVEAARVELATLLAGRDQKLRLFRFPYLREGETRAKLDAMRAYLAGTGQRNLCPTLDTQDWSFEAPWVEASRANDAAGLARVGERYQRTLRTAVEYQEEVGDRLFGRTVPQVLLLHANAVGAAGWGELFAWLVATGHRFAGADEVLADAALAEPHDYVGDYGPGLWHRIEAGRNGARAEREIRDLLAEQIDQWNAGRIEEFCSVYADDARFVSPSGIRQGRAEVLARYRERYPDRSAMGRLALDILDVRLLAGTEVTMLGDAVPGRVHGASVAARWQLTYADQEPKSGVTLIVFRRAAGRWWIVDDASM